jgi:hypothetical protein
MDHFLPNSSTITRSGILFSILKEIKEKKYIFFERLEA